MNEAEFYLFSIQEALEKSKEEDPKARLSAIVYILTDGDEHKYESIISILSKDYKLN